MSSGNSPREYRQPESPTEEYDERYYEQNQRQNNPEDLGPPASPDGSPDYTNEYPDAPQSPEQEVPHSPEHDIPQSPEQEGPQSPDFDYEDDEAQKPATPEDNEQSPAQLDQTSDLDEPKSPDNQAHNYSDEDQIPKSPEEETEAVDEHENDSPSKRRRIVLSDDEDEEIQQEAAPEQEGENITHLDISDDSDEEGAAEKPAEVDKLMTNIFGDDSDEEGDQQEGIPQRSDDEEGAGYDEEKEWDFDRIMEEKKRERSKKRKHRKDGSIDLCSNADGQIRHVVDLMKNAAAEDREANNQRRPAIQKTKMIEVVRNILLRADYLEALIENDMMSAISEWLAPLPDKSLPALEIRATLLKILSSFPHLEPGVLKQSGLGKAVMLIFKHPKETRENKILASNLIRNWSQPIFQISTDYSSISRDEREVFDFEHLPEAKRRKIEQLRTRGHGAGPSRLVQVEENVLRPGDPGFISRARVPKASTSAYIIRPKPNIEGNFRGPTKNRQNTRFDRTQRDFKERTKSTKSERAIGVSIEGRRMD